MPERTVTDRLHSLVRSAIVHVGLPGKRLVVAVSGGPDSLALLYALDHLRGAFGLTLYGAHLNHMLRGEQSEADARFVADTFMSLGIPHTVEAADAAAYRREHRLSLEDAARRLRYAFLGKVAAEHGADAVALGHTADDQAETVLMHVIRGSGLAGLRGMAPVSRRAIDGRQITLVRPMLGVSRQETLAYCRALGLQPRLDESNLSPEFTRNRVRLELMPLLEQFNPSIRDALLRLCQSAGWDAALIESLVDDAWKSVASTSGSAIVLDRKAFLALHPSLQRHMLRRAVLEAKGDLDGVELVHIDDMLRLISSPAAKSLDLPGGLRMFVSYEDATISRGDIEQGPLPPFEGEHRLNIPSETMVSGWRVVADIEDFDPLLAAPWQGGEQEGVELSARLDFDSVGGELLARSRRPGDRFQPLGMAQSKKLQDFMVDEKIPRHWRERVPLVVSPRGIAWVAGWRVAEWARVTDKTRRVLTLHFERES